jgi:hypothetical protein
MNLSYPTSMAWYYDDDGVWWCTAEDTSGVVSARAVKYRMVVYFHVDATDFSSDHTLYLTIRYKDDLKEGVSGGAPVYIWNGGSSYTHLGNLGGTYDHRWKTEQFTVLPGERSVTGDGDFVVRIGVEQYGDHLIGELPVDKMKLSDDTDIHEFEPDGDGFWPHMPASNFQDIGVNNEYISGEGPFFPFGVYDWLYFWVSDGGSATTPGHGEKDAWQIMEDAHMNCYVVHGWQQNWYDQWVEHPGEFSWDDPGIAVEPGLSQHLIHAAAHNLKVIPNFLTETRSWWITYDFGSEQRTLDSLHQIMYDYRNDPNILMWYLVDEWDHEDVTYGKPHIFSRQLYQQQRLADPNRPGITVLMGFMGPTSWDLVGEIAEVVGTDYYLYGSTVEQRLLGQAQRLDEMRSALGNSAARIMVPEGMGGDPLHDGERRTIYPEEIVVQAYLAIAHGAQGLIYFRAMHPNDPTADGWGGYARGWEGLRQVGEELFGAEGIAHALLYPSTTVDIMGESGVVTSSNSAIHHICKMTVDGEVYLITVNVRNTPQSTTLHMAGLEEGTILRVLFEGRVVEAQEGLFVDDFDGYERHVYKVDRVSRSEVDRAIREHKEGRATDQEVEDWIERYYRGE